MKPLTKMQAIAKQRGGKCLSKRYINSKEHLLWQCSKGHEWKSTPFSVKTRRSWCPVCAGNKPLGLESMHKLARSRGGECLSVEYSNVKTKMLWQCKDGHQFQSTADNVKQGKWCPYCKKNNNKIAFNE
jgi:hypothetical protein